MWTVLITFLALTGVITWISIIYVLISLHLIKGK
jgi:hypothetical protein